MSRLEKSVLHYEGVGNDCMFSSDAIFPFTQSSSRHDDCIRSSSDDRKSDDQQTFLSASHNWIVPRVVHSTQRSDGAILVTNRHYLIENSETAQCGGRGGVIA